MMSNLIVTDDHHLPVIRRSGNYKPCVWDDDFVQTLATHYTEQRFSGRVTELKGNVKEMLNNVTNPLDQLELIDNLQRLGLGHHFEQETRTILKKIHEERAYEMLERKDLHATALEFRLLRQHGFNISQDVFKSFMENGSFKDCLCGDAKGILSLYEAYFFSFEGESLLEAAWSFTSKTLAKHLDYVTDRNLSIKVRQALELPLNWRMPRLDAFWYINLYERCNNMNPALLELAKLEYNIVQGLYQEELKIVSRWWKKTGFSNKLSFTRDRLVQSFVWSVGICPEPQFGYCRMELAKQIQIISAIDDIYDVYGTLDELELFTDAIKRWDINSIQILPDYMKVCFVLLYNFVHEQVYHTLREQNLNVLPHLRKVWADLVKCYMVEARWYYTGYKPTLEEYLENGIGSIAQNTIMVQSYICSTNPIKMEALEFLASMPDILRFASIISRTVDDFGTSSDELARGDVPKAPQCYMNDNGASEEVAHQELMGLVRKKWTQVNKCRMQDDMMPLTSSFIEIMLNPTRAAHCIYVSGDGYGIEGGRSKDTLFSLIVQPIPL